MTAIDVSVLVPVYNNAATLEELIDRIVAVLEPTGVPFEIVLVDDGSRDASWAILEARAARDDRVRPFALVRNFGSQAAACAGFDLARGRRLVAMDADLENCPEDIPALLEPLDRGIDLVCGYRQVRGAPWLSRRLPSQLMNVYVRRQTGIRIRDVGCGMRAFPATLVADLDSEGDARRMLTPVLVRRARSIAEVPLSPGAKQKSGGHSFLSLLGIAVDYYMLTARRPFVAAGMASMTGVAAGLLLLASRWSTAGLVLIVAGLIGVQLCLVGEYGQRLYQLSQGLPFYKLRETAARQDDPV